ncbi:hypothetical protein ACNKHW_26275 [Shigella flexneri]
MTCLTRHSRWKSTGTLLPRYVLVHGGPRVFAYYTPKEESLELYHDFLDLHRSNPNLWMCSWCQSVMFGRAPGHEKGEVNPPLRMLNGVQKFFAVLWLGRDSLSGSHSRCRCAVWRLNTARVRFIAQKLARVARIHFSRQVWLLSAHICRLVRIYLVNLWNPTPCQSSGR